MKLSMYSLHYINKSLPFWLLISFAVAIQAKLTEEECLLERGHYFHCNISQLCIPISWVCDGSSDCNLGNVIDGSDELFCDDGIVKGNNGYSCNSELMFRCALTHFCLDKKVVCNGVYDCGPHDFSDESNCPKESVACEGNEIMCNDSKTCISKTSKCDGRIDCPGGWDELNCQENCKGFLCSSGECIVAQYKCDGMEDCYDGSDEEHCPPWSRQIEHCKLEFGFFLCEDKLRCLNISHVCDNHRDCNDGSDESGDCNINECERGNCSKLCLRLPKGPKCVCPFGTKDIHGKCEDINECERFGQCDQICINTNGSYFCKCHEGYELEGHVCKANESEGFLVHTEKDKINGIFLSSNNMITLLTGIGVPASVSYDGHMFYWLNSQDNKQGIYRAIEYSTDHETVVTAGIGVAEDIAVDWITKNIYYSDSKLSHIAVCSYEGFDCTPLINLQFPRAVVLYSTKGLLFYSDWNNDLPHIGKVGMDGFGEKQLVITDLKWPIGLAVDLFGDRLYWADARLRRIETVKLDGRDRRLIVSDVRDPFSLDLFENTLYWSDWGKNTIESCNKFSGKDRRRVYKSKKEIYGLHVYHPSLLRKFKQNPCKQSNCSHLCLLSETNTNELKYRCGCPLYHTLDSDSHHCVFNKKKQYIAAVSDSMLNILEYKTFGKFGIREHRLNVKHVGAVAYNSLTDSLIISDLTDGSLHMYNQRTNELKKWFQADANGRICSMDFDPNGNNLYYSDSTKSSIEIVNMNSLINIELIGNFGPDILLDIALAYDVGALFVALQNKHHIHIDRFSMDGNILDRMHVIESDLVGPYIAMTYDQNSQQLYWSDSGTGIISSVDNDGYHIIKHAKPQTSIHDLSVVGNHIFYVNKWKNVLYWAEFFDSQQDINDAQYKQMMLDSFFNNSDIKLLKMNEGPTNSNHVCFMNNGGCSHLCVPLKDKMKCLCPNDMKLSHNEITCLPAASCDDDEYKCSDGKCISMALKCNTIVDCLNGEDEKNCDGNLKCPISQFPCHDGNKCIDSHRHCNGINDCNDGSDEKDCSKNKTCSNGEFHCFSGECVYAFSRCDNKTDCLDGSDEDKCDMVICNIASFSCKSGGCIPKGWECDGDQDCVDSSDEHSNCYSKLICDSQKQFKCKNGHCISKNLVCNDEDDCDDLSDEENCSHKVRSPATCNGDHYECPSDHSVCLPHEAKCNGTAECPRAEDEEGCNCQNDQFKCSNSSHCVSKNWLCDNVNDCSDGSDEQNCPEKHMRSNLYSKCDGFNCRSSSCIPWHKVCDSIKDCPDGSDEGNMCEKKCINAKCSHTCHATPTGFKCSCPTGYTLDGSGLNCVDENECFGSVCSQFCKNTLGSFNCFCDEAHYDLRSDGQSCKARGQKMEFIYATSNEIRSKLNLFMTSQKLGLNFNGLDVSGLDVDMNSEILYWTSTKGKVFRLNMTSLETQQISNLTNPSKISFDWITQNVYFVENGRTIEACNFDRKACAHIYSVNNGALIDSLRIDSIERKMFWSESHSMNARDAVSVLKQSDLAGKYVKILVSNNIRKVGDIALDNINRIVYWTDVFDRKVEKISFNGDDRKVLFQKIREEPLHLNFFEGYIYWLNGKPAQHDFISKTNYITKCSMYGIPYKECQTIRLLPGLIEKKVLNVKIRQPALQPKKKNACDDLKCAYMCVLGQNAPQCICSDASLVSESQNCTTISDANFFTSYDEDVIVRKNSSWQWAWWILLLIPIVALGFLFYKNGYNVSNICKSRQAGLSRAYFHQIGLNRSYNSGYGNVGDTIDNNHISSGNHVYENILAKGKDTMSSWGVSLNCNNEINISRGKWPDDQKLISNTTEENDLEEP